MQTQNCTQEFQHTLAAEVFINGVGIHTGQTVEMVLKPAEPNTGIIFRRVDLDGKPVVKADVDNVVETTRSTTIEANGARVSTIEHLMAALVGCKVDNVVIELNAPKCPYLMEVQLRL
jgi:UDP-3-O-[3-hydroxymyristoyl] N-acetylglucosamine deacetylase/3-hydroxyacyl-[acyl-carrier-protein] dehydratase